MKRPYEAEIVDAGDHEIIRADFPYCVRALYEDARDFETRAKRDFDLIIKFVPKFARSVISNENIAHEVLKSFKPRVEDYTAFFCGFINEVTVDNMQDIHGVLDEVYVQCIGNLPSMYVKGGLTKGAAPKLIKQSKDKEPRQLMDAVRAKDRIEVYSQPVSITVPKPQNGFTAAIVNVLARH